MGNMALVNQELLLAKGRDIDAAYANLQKMLAKHPRPVKVVSISSQLHTGVLNVIFLFVVVEFV
jgi:uncharacterized protein HemY